MNDSIKQPGRNKVLDIYKGIGIMLIVLGHLAISKLLYNFIYMFHVPAFFFVAGMTFKIKENESVLTFLKKKAYRLLIPYVLFTLIISLTQMATQLFVGETSDLSSFSTAKGFGLGLLDIILCGGIDGTWVTVGPAWFLFVLFFASLLFFAANKLIVSNLVRGGGIIALFILVLLLKVTDNVPFKIGQSISAMFFMWCGMVFNRRYKKMSLYRNQWLLLLFPIIGFGVVLLTTWLLNDSVNMMGNYFTTKPILASFVSLIGCLSLFFLSSVLEDKKLNKLFCFFGVNSMLVLGIHFPVKNLLRLFFSKIGLTAEQSVIPIFVLVLVLMIPLAYFVNKYCLVLVGQKSIKNKK